jgi:hypothetical protein
MSSVHAVGPTGSAPHLVAPERTPVSMPLLQGAIGRAYQRVMGQAPSTSLLRSLTAQASLETGAGTSMYNYNFGGVKGVSPSGSSASCLTHEVVDGTDLTLHQGFRAYASVDEGAEDYVRVVVQKFGHALPAAAAGDLDGFAHALKQAGYYTASEADYAAALKSASVGLDSGKTSPILPVPSSAAFASSVDMSRLFDALSASALRIAEPTSSK